MTTATRFDLDNLNTAATRALAEREGTLKAIIEKRTREATDQAEKMTITELKAAVAEAAADKDMKTSAPKSEWVSLYVEEQVMATPYYKERAKLHNEAGRDRMLAHQLNDLLQQSDDADDKLRQITTDKHGRALFVEMTWNIDDCFAAQAAGHLAREVLTGVTEHGAELRELAMAVLKTAVRTLLNLPSHIRSNGLAGGYRMGALMEALGADAYRAAVTLYMPQDEPIDVSFLRTW